MVSEVLISGVQSCAPSSPSCEIHTLTPAQKSHRLHTVPMCYIKRCSANLQTGLGMGMGQAAPNL